ncbi:unnamed protein product [Zymoseptoria tritici ST99CH_1E4]|uniref:Uncharacterized protein n=1 Tax=Zymoseptoria tritici ST99CH_1E4 TaxID=1276532 RepID=A0A2H1G3P4_ZYMTR|nr:unnamed protein product [Zymoseptoria tritici ST99CH_1E4]
MRRWIQLRTQSNFWRRSTSCTGPLASRHVYRYSQEATTDRLPQKPEQSHRHHGSKAKPQKPFAGGKSPLTEHRWSGRNVDEFVALLDGALPPHLRSQQLASPQPALGARDVAEVLLEAQYPSESKIEPCDLLHHIAFVRGRWNAAVWLVKRLVDKFPLEIKMNPSSTETKDLWGMAGHLFDATDIPIMLDLPFVPPPTKVFPSVKLDDLTGGPWNDSDIENYTAHDVLGQIWRTLGRMTLECVGGDVRPEVREMIAYLHHREIMPMTIYHFNPGLEKTTIQQPPLIPLLSSRILTALSDAAWNAEQRLVGEAAKARIGTLTAAQGRAKVRMEGIRPEVWIELVLWSCLHGGWVQQGAAILYDIVTEDVWSPLSWREYEKTLPTVDQMNDGDWNGWEYAFKTRPTSSMSSMDGHTGFSPGVEQTVSAEVVNAYIDAIASVAKDSFSGNLYANLMLLRKFKAFLQKGNLGLSFGSWDGLVARVLEVEQMEPELDSSQATKAVDLSPGLGQGLEDKNSQDLPKYVLDNGSAMAGILHRALQGAINRGETHIAHKVFSTLRKRADADKLTSITSFLEGNRPLFKALSANEMFTSNLPGIEYPGFEMQLPASTLGPFLALNVRQDYFAYARKLIYTDDLDGAVIPESMYGDPFISGPLIEFAAKTNDRALLIKLKSHSSEETRPTILDLHVDAMRWDSASRTLDHLTLTKNEWHMYSLANIASKIVFLEGQESNDKSNDERNRKAARQLFERVYRMYSQSSRTALVRAQTLLTIFSTIDEKCAKFCSSIVPEKGFHDFRCSAIPFNRLLSGVLAVHGSIVGRRVLSDLWPSWARRSAARPSGGVHNTRLVIKPPHGSRSVVYGSLQPDAQTIFMILSQAMQEADSSASEGPQPSTATEDMPLVDVSPQAGGRVLESIATQAPIRQPDRPQWRILMWSIGALWEIAKPYQDTVDMIDDVLVKHGGERFRAELPGLVQKIYERKYSRLAAGRKDELVNN